MWKPLRPVTRMALPYINFIFPKLFQFILRSHPTIVRYMKMWTTASIVKCVTNKYMVMDTNCESFSLHNILLFQNPDQIFSLEFSS
jgi:hypothetical protein